MYWDKALHAYEFILVFSAAIHLVRVVQEFDSGFVRNGDPWNFKKKKTVEEAYVLTASICFIHRASPRYVTLHTRSKSKLFSSAEDS